MTTRSDFNRLAASRLLALSAALCALLHIAIGLDISGRFLGLMGSHGGFIPFTIPELTIYKNTLRRGFAKTELYLVDLETNKVVHHSGPVEGAAYRRSKTYFFVFETRESDTTRLE